MSLVSQLSLAFQRIAAEFKAVRTEFAPETGTTLSSAQAPAISKPWSAFQTKSMILGLINDASSSATDRTWSASKIVNYVASNGGGGNAAFTPLGTYDIPAGQLQTFPTGGGTEAQRVAVLKNNSGIVCKALVEHPGMKVQMDPSQAWPLQAELNEIIGTYVNASGTAVAFTAGQDYCLAGRALLVPATFANKTESLAPTRATAVQQKPVLSLTRKTVGSAFTPTNLRNNFTIGQTPPTQTGSIFTSQVSAFDITSGINRFRGGALIHLTSQDTYDGWSFRAGYGTKSTDGITSTVPGTGIYKAAFFPVAGIALTVTNLSYTAINTAAGLTGSDALASMERRVVVGATSGATALVQGDMTGDNKVTINGASADFTVGETLKDQATGATIGTLSLISVYSSSLLNTTYSTSPVMRVLGRSALDLSGLIVEVDGDVDAIMPDYNRPDCVFLAGCTDVNIDGLRILGGYGAGLVLRSCWNVTGLVNIRGLANHAIETDARESAYGYGVRLLGCTQNFGIGISIEYSRHACTTNGIRNSFNLNSRTGSTSGSADLCTNFWAHGPGGRKGYFYGKASHMWGTAWDTHEGSEDIVWINPVAIDPMSAGRSTTSPDGITLRGFNLTVINPYFRGVRIGIAEMGAPLDSGGLVWTNTVQGGVVDDFQLYGWQQTEDAFSESQSRMRVIGTVFRGDAAIPTSVYAQAGLMIRRGNADFDGVRIESVNDRMVRFVSFSGSGGSSAVGRVSISAKLDWTDATASRAFSVEATYAAIDIVSAHAKVNAVAGTRRPFYWITNQAGNSVIRYGNLRASYLSSTTQDPELQQVTGGTPTITAWVGLGGAGGAAGADGKSAYDLAVAGGYSGTQAQWLASLVGPKGADSTVPGPPSTVPGPAGVGVSVGIPTGWRKLVEYIRTAVSPVAPTANSVYMYPLNVRGASIGTLGVQTGAAQVGGAVSFKIAVFADVNGLPDLTSGPIREVTVDLTQTAGKQDAALPTALSQGNYWVATGYFVTTAPTTVPTIIAVNGVAWNLPVPGVSITPVVFSWVWRSQTGWPTSFASCTQLTTAEAPAVYEVG